MEGARRIWNTYIHATTKTIKNAISRFCNIEGLKIKRKIRMNNRTGKNVWWFIVHGDESTLRELDSKWECLHAQASWELQPCTKPAVDGDTTEASSESQLTPMNVNNGDDTSKDPPQGNPDEATRANTTTTPTSSPHHATVPNAPFLDAANQST